MHTIKAYLMNNIYGNFAAHNIIKAMDRGVVIAIEVSLRLTEVTSLDSKTEKKNM